MPDRSDLIDRRAALLEQIDAEPSLQDQLDAVTDQLRQLLSDGSAGVRRLIAGRDDQLIERLGTAEVVHPLTGTDDLADRVADDRRCFVLEHPDLPGRPTNVVWVALSQGVFEQIDSVLDPSAPTVDAASADTATFYSIWNIEPGLSGIAGGHDLLVGAMALLSDELPGLVEYRTLSPVPGLRRHLGDRDPGDQLGVAAATYLTTLRADGRPVDPVARFHLGNGARLAAVYPEGNLGERGLAQSFGAMCSYRYAPEDRAANRAELASGTVPVSDSVQQLCQQPG